MKNDAFEELLEDHIRPAKKNRSFREHLENSVSLLKDHPEDIRRLIHWVATLNNEERFALIMAYKALSGE